MPLFPPTLRLKEPQEKPASSIPTEKLKEISDMIFGAATPPPGAKELTRPNQDQRRGYQLWATSSCTSGTE
jgi:hypothetical protein